jgi:diguanylate cyclase
MRRFLVLYCLLFGTLAAAQALADEQAAFEQRLRKAEALRSADQQAFSTMVTALEADAVAATPEQRQRLRLLRAYRHAFSGRTAESIREAEAVIAEKPGVVIRYRAGGLLANNYAVAGRFVEGVSMMEKTLTLTGKVDDKDARHQVLTTAGILYNQMGQYALGQRYAEQVLADTPGKRLRCLNQNLRLESLQRLGASPGESVFETAIEDCVAQNEQIIAGFGRTYLARKLHAEGQVNRAIALLETHLPEVRATGYPRVLAEVYSLLAQFHFEAGRLASASDYANRTIQQATQPLPLSVAHKVLYDIAQDRGEWRQALTHYRSHAEAERAHLNEVNAREMAYQIVRQEIRRQGQRIELLNRSNQVLQLQRQVDKQSAANMRVVTGLLLLLLAAIAYWAYRIKRMERTLRQRSEIDSLTGVYSRQHFHRCAQTVLARSAERRSDVALIMFDLDHFKDCNDRHGHDVGDWVLRRAAQACSGVCRKGDLIGRLGGEEFALLVLDIRQDGALRVAEACRQAIEHIDSSSTGKTVSPTASFGVAMASAADYDLTTMLSRADKALYRAKHDGRNRVRAYEEEPAEAAAPRLRLAHPVPATTET